MDSKRLFLQHVAQTSPSPLAIDILKAKGSYIWDRSGNKYLDVIAGISVCNIGHCHPAVLKAIRKQIDQYLHVLVYGEMIETPQVQYARTLSEHLPATLNSVYFTNSGAEAVEGAMKLAKRVTGRTEIVAFNKSYHGSTQGALSIMGDEYWRNAFRPLLPGIGHYEHNEWESIDAINSNTACVILEVVQAERGVYTPQKQWLQALKRKCDDTGALLVFDEIQTGFGRCGSLWAFEQYDVVPDILLLGKALGGGMPLGAFIANKSMMDRFTENPVLGHITTFGGHPVNCAAGLAAFNVLIKDDVLKKVRKKEKLFHNLLSVQGVKAVRSSGLLIAVEFEDETRARKIIEHCIRHGVLTDWFLFAPHCMRIAPPLTISRSEIEKACKVISNAIALYTR
jgi:acetylornithine/N-succinyldiaminopimelate aminotransferase